MQPHYKARLKILISHHPKRINIISSFLKNYEKIFFRTFCLAKKYQKALAGPNSPAYGSFLLVRCISAFNTLLDCQPTLLPFGLKAKVCRPYKLRPKSSGIRGSKTLIWCSSDRRPLSARPLAAKGSGVGASVKSFFIGVIRDSGSRMPRIRHG